MKKLAIILDSFCGRHKEEIEKIKDMFYLPLKIILDDKEYKVGSDVPNDKLMLLLNKAKSAKTSMPSPAEIINLFEKLSKEYEQVIYFPLSSAISGTAKAAMNIKKDFKKVEVIESIMVGKIFVEISNYLLRMAKENKTKETILALAKDYIETSVQTSFVIPKKVETFIRSGRLGRVVGELLTKINAVPIISFENNEKLHKKSLKRSGKKAIQFAVNKLLKIKENLEENIKKDCEFLICHTIDEEMAQIAKNLLESKGEKVQYEKTTALVHATTGDGAVSISILRRKK